MLTHLNFVTTFSELKKFELSEGISFYSNSNIWTHQFLDGQNIGDKCYSG